jgi:hypothetical protein
MSIKRIATLVFLMASASMLLLGALVLPWWDGELAGGSFQVDLRSMQICLKSICGDPKPLSIADASGAGWAKLGISAFAASLVAALLLVGCVWKTLRRRPKSTFHWIAGVMAFFAGLLGLLFIWLRPEFGHWNASYGLACSMAGAIVGAIAASASARVAVTETAAS